MSEGVTANIFIIKSNMHMDLDTPSKIENVPMQPMDPPVLKQVDRIPPNVIEHINLI